MITKLVYDKESRTLVSQFQSPLRDLILRLDAVAVAHPAYSQAADALSHLRTHLSALARCEEINQKPLKIIGTRPGADGRTVVILEDKHGRRFEGVLETSEFGVSLVKVEGLVA